MSSIRKIHSDPAAAAAAVADLIIETVRQRPDCVLGLATGSTVEPVYAALVAACRRGDVSFARVRTFNLDEYRGVAPDAPVSYRATMQRLLFDHIDIDPANTHVPDGQGEPLAAANAYEAAIVAAGGIDLQLLGIGRNGHIGFNEPGTPFGSRTGVVDLHPDTLTANTAVVPGGRVPPTAITMGIATILDARRIVVLATGAAKAAAVRAALMGPVDPACPASALRRHDAVIWQLDAAAAAGLQD